MNDKDIARQNKLLAETSKIIFGDTAILKIVDPKSLILLKKNARYFKKDTFKQLVSNIKQDKRLSSVPLCHIIKNGAHEVLSGNHRVEASIQAGVPWVMVIVLLEKISTSEKIAIQLSHNALVGVDDANLLADLWSKIDDIKTKLYAGLSSDTVKEIENIKLVTFTTPQVYTKSVTFAFTDTEKDILDEVVKELGMLTSNDVYMAHIDQFNDFFNALQKIKKTGNIKNGSLAMIKLIEIVQRELTEAAQCPL